MDSFTFNIGAQLIIRFRCLPTAVVKLESGKLKVSWTNEAKQEFSDEYDTILFAIGRRALTKELNLENAGVKVAGDGEKIDAINEQTNVPHIYAVGDVLYVSRLFLPKRVPYVYRITFIIFFFLTKT